MKLSQKADAAMSTGLCGYVEATRRELQAIYGPPNMADDPDGGFDGKVTTEWGVEAPDGHEWRIYDWKTGAPGMDERYEWHIGGKAACLPMVAAAMPAHVVYTMRGERVRPK